MTESFTIGLDVSALNLGFKEHALRGIGRYVFELDKFFSTHSTAPIVVKPFRHEEFCPSPLVNSFINALPYGKQTVRQQLVMPINFQAKSNGRFDLLHFPAHMDAPSWSIKNYVLTVLDLIPLVLSDLYQADRPTWKFKLARWLEMKAIKNAQHIIAISNHTKDDVHKILNIPREKISVTHLGVDASFFKPVEEQLSHAVLEERFAIPRNSSFVLYVGGIDQRKNISILIRSFGKVVEYQKTITPSLPRLVLAGKIDQDRQYPRLKSLINENGLDELVIETGFVSDEELQMLYKRCALFFFPSLYEGFGLPPLEAMASGAAVVSSNTSSMPEVLGDGALLVDPKDEDSCANAICTVLNNEQVRNTLVEKGREQAARFPWKKTGEQTLSVYQSLYAKCKANC